MTCTYPHSCRCDTQAYKAYQTQVQDGQTLYALYNAAISSTDHVTSFDPIRGLMRGRRGRL